MSQVLAVWVALLVLLDILDTMQRIAADQYSGIRRMFSVLNIPISMYLGYVVVSTLWRLP